MDASPALVVIGAGLAGAKAAEAARAAGHPGPIVLVGDEPGVPYERPPLSKEVLRGEVDLAETHVHPDGFYDDHDIELVTDPAVDLDLVARAVRLASGRELGFGALVMATGAAPRRLPVIGGDLDGVHLLRTGEDAIRLSEAIRSATRVAVVGAGWIGTEVAASARQMGAEVVLIDPAPVPLHRVVGAEIGAAFASLHADHGVVLRLGLGVRELLGSGSVDGVALENGKVEPADVVVIGVGVTPRIELAERAGLRIENGVVVDEHLETSVPGVFAAGDIANAYHPHYGRHLRVEHWANALHQGATAGRNAAGHRDAYTRLPYFYSDQYDLGLEYVGHGSAEDDLVIRGDIDARRFVAFWLRDGIVTAAMSVNVWEVIEDLKSVVASGQRIDPARLADADLPLPELVPA